MTVLVTGAAATSAASPSRPCSTAASRRPTSSPPPATPTPSPTSPRWAWSRAPPTTRPGVPRGGPRRRRPRPARLLERRRRARGPARQRDRGGHARPASSCSPTPASSAPTPREPRPGRRAPPDRGAAGRVRAAGRAAAQLVVPRELHRAGRDRARARGGPRCRRRGPGQRRRPAPTSPGRRRASWPPTTRPVASTSSAATRRSPWRSTPPRWPPRPGSEVAYRDLPAAEYTAALGRRGLPAPYAEILADSDLGIARGELQADSGDLSRLIGRPTTRSPTRSGWATVGAPDA